MKKILRFSDIVASKLSSFLLNAYIRSGKKIKLPSVTDPSQKLEQKITVGKAPKFVQIGFFFQMHPNFVL